MAKNESLIAFMALDAAMMPGVVVISSIRRDQSTMEMTCQSAFVISQVVGWQV
jgi:hypothetical protein